MARAFMGWCVFLFVGHYNNNLGGWHDYRGTYSDVEEAEVELAKLNDGQYTWAHMVCGGIIIAEYKPHREVKLFPEPYKWIKRVS